jgi:hypothetical protein
MHPTLKADLLAPLAAKVLAGKQATGRTGMDLWQILVLGVVRLGLDADWDRMEDMANHHTLVRQMLGLRATPWDDQSQRFGHQTLRDHLAVGRELSGKVRESLSSLCDQPVDLAHWETLAYFHRLLDKHLGLVERRLLNLETAFAAETPRRRVPTSSRIGRSDGFQDTHPPGDNSVATEKDPLHR